MIKITAVGGYDEVGRNMTLVKVDSEAVVFDMGLHMENYIALTESREDLTSVDTKTLIDNDVVPDVSKITKDIANISAIVPTHAHLDHLGAVPFLAENFKADIICTPFTKEVLCSILHDDGFSINNKIRVLNINSKLKLSPKLTLEFINSTHSTPQTVMAALHTRYGVVLYANDFKFDEFPTFGLKTNIEALRDFGNKHNVVALIVDSTYANSARKTPSESVAKEMLRDVMLGTNTKGSGVIVTTFSSHIARLKSIVEFSKKMKRQPVFMGRSLYRYITAAERINLINFTKDVKLVKYGSKIKKELKRIEKEGKQKFVLVVTGHQGEPDSTLSKIARQDYKFKLNSNDFVIFSCNTIPTPINQHNRLILEQKLKSFHVRVFKDIHVSGHASKEDLRDLIELVKPKHLIPAHGDIRMRTGLAELADEMGYDTERHVHLLGNGSQIVLNSA